MISNLIIRDLFMKWYKWCFIFDGKFIIVNIYIYDIYYFIIFYFYSINGNSLLILVLYNFFYLFVIYVRCNCIN